MNEVKKLWRFMMIYGPVRALFKVAGRLRRGKAAWLSLRFWPVKRDIGVIGCGQFAFATIGYVITSRLGARFCRCFDVDRRAMCSFEDYYSVPLRSASAGDVVADPEVGVVYVASNHATHTPYAVAALKAGKTVYVEKPVSVSRDQLRELVEARREVGGRLYAGYNRPFSKAVRLLREACAGVEGPLVVSYFISGHQIQADHWYRNPGEGTRICGNVGHWLDLTVHMLSWQTLVDQWTIRLVCSNADTRDDNITLSLVSERGDMVTIVLVSLTEPFEGINESVDLQWGGVIAKIDDFRSMTLRRHAYLAKYRFWPKDVGHVRAIMQPFRAPERDWREVELSSLLMLHIAEMVTRGVNESRFSFSDAWQQLGVSDAALAR